MANVVLFLQIISVPDGTKFSQLVIKYNGNKQKGEDSLMRLVLMLFC